MNMTEKNGQPSMEEILASIRRIIAEEPGQPHNGELGGTPILLRGDGVLDDAGEFDLPAIFRASPPQTDRQTPLLGRLTDAIRNATAAQPETHAVADDEAEVHYAPEQTNGHHSGLSSLSVRTAEAPRGDAGPALNGTVYAYEPPVAVAEEAPTHVPAVTASAPSADEPKRVMAAFKDTHFMRLAGPSSTPVTPAPTPLTSAAIASEPLPSSPELVVADFAPPVQLERAAVEPPPLSPEPIVLDVAPVVVAMPPPPLPAAPRPAAEASGGIEDATADLLRPMLRQWLAENMPRMVEKALHIEIAESVKAPKKP